MIFLGFSSFFSYIACIMFSLFFQMGGLLAGASDIAYKDIKANPTAKKASDARVAKLGKKLKEFKSSHTEKESKWTSDLQEARNRAEEAEKESGLLKAEIEELMRRLGEKKDDAAIIAEFKKFSEYDEAMATAGAPEVQRCWVIAERHVKTDPYASRGTFIEEFVAAKKAIEDGKGEPEPYNGPSPSFIPAPPSQDGPDNI